MTETSRRPTLARLRQMATGGTASIGFSVAATNVLRIISSMTLTRLLDSYAYGVVGVITSVAYMMAMLSDIGLTPFVVRHAQGDDRAMLDQVWTIRLIRGCALAIVMMLLAGPVTVLLGKPELSTVVAVWGLSFVLDGLQSLAFLTAIRQRQLWRLSLLDLITGVVTFLVSLIMAFALRTYWAMIAGMLAGVLARVLFSYTIFAQSRRRWHFSRARAQELWRFSRYIAMSSILTLLIMQSDKIVLARLMPLSLFGLYAIAVTLAAAPAALANPYAQRVLYPAYAEAARTRPDSLSKVFYASRRKIVLLYMFATAGVIGAAPLLIGLLYDPRYWGVVPFLRLIMIGVVLRLANLASDQVLIALGRTRSTLAANIYRVTWLAVGGAAALAVGNILLLVAVVGTIEVAGSICNWINLRRAGLLDLKEESYGFAAAAAGLGLGYAVSRVAMGLFPHL